VLANGLKADRAAHDKAAFGLDPENQDDAKKIAQAMKRFNGLFDRIRTRADDRYRRAAR
jgi:hypothetical protein